MKKYKFSLIIPVRHETEYLRETLIELKKQTFKNFEVLVIDDNLSKTAEPSKKRNLGAKLSTGDYLAFLDDDSFPHPEWLANLNNLINQYPQYAAFCGPCLTPAGDNIYQQASGLVWSSLLGSGGAGFYRNSISHPRFVDDYPTVNLIVKKSDFKKIGGFQSKYWPGEDTILCLDLVKKLRQKIFYHPDVLVYHHRRNVFIPVLVFFYFQKLRLLPKRVLIVSLLIFLTISLPNLLNLFSPESQARSRWVGIINPNSINLINENRRLYSGPEIFNRLINNKVTYFSKQFAINYLDLVNPFPIFFNGSENYQFNPPHTGLIFSIFLPFFFVGLIFSLQKYPRLFLLFTISLLPSALTIGDFPSIRASAALPFYFIFISIGLYHISTKTILIPIMVIALFQLVFYLKQYLSYTQNFSQTWQYGYQSAINYVKPLYPDYTSIVFTKKYGEPHEFVLFYWPWDPKSYLSDPNLKTDNHSDWYWVDAFDKFKFVNDWEIKTLSLPTKTLLITSPHNYPPAAKPLTTVYFLNNTPAFDIVSYEP